MNQKGRTERIFVNLEAIYPDPDVIGTELSLEELRAGQRGWLKRSWEPETSKQDFSITASSPLITEQPEEQVAKLTEAISEKLVIARDPVALDENGVMIEPAREGRGRRMKIKEVNETQISRFHTLSCDLISNIE